LLLVTAVIEGFHGFRYATNDQRRSAWTSGAITAGLGLLFMNAPAIVGTTLVVLIAFWFAIDGTRCAGRAFRLWQTNQSFAWDAAAAAAGNFAVVGLLVLLGSRSVIWTLTIAAALRIFGTAANLLRAEVLVARDAVTTAVSDLGLPDHPRLTALRDQIDVEEAARLPVDRAWTGILILTLFAIHLGRMGLDRSSLGILSPLFAVAGDLVVALGIAYVVVVPLAVVLRLGASPLANRAWQWCLSEPDGDSPWDWRRRLVWRWLTYRLRFAVRLKQVGYSFPNAIGRGLQIGLPAAAIVAATTPIWGMSWYFDTENYAAGIWNSWAEARTDTWREAMTNAVTAQAAARQQPPPAFRVEPPELSSQGDFSFIVIGDTGEGDASQHVLRDQLVSATEQPEVRFVVLSSDVIYPSGAMKDYEARFWLPFKGVTKPVYAIPGNHDWFDALEGFAATFLEPDAARTAMRARVEADLRLTSTTDAQIEALIQEASRLRAEYRVPTGFQQGPFFQLQTDQFALLAVDTGVQKRVDGAQLAWLEAGLTAARGKFKMVVLGHPLYAVGEYRAHENADFAALHELLREHDVGIVMAGDTHDLEYYAEVRQGAPTIHHVVNGGGGAFLTMGAQLTDHESFPVRDWAYYPATAPLVAKVSARNPFWKVPLWWWTRELGAWPSAPEWLSAAFDYNTAPFFQSFVEVRVEPSARRVRLLPRGVHGRLRWVDLETSDGLRPAGTSPEMPVEWTVPMQP
jgi:3',5'-cyclic AMP phosphodiesterase CpdA